MVLKIIKNSTKEGRRIKGFLGNMLVRLLEDNEIKYENIINIPPI